MFKIVTALALVALSAAVPVPDDGKSNPEIVKHVDGNTKNEDEMMVFYEEFGEDVETAVKDVKEFEVAHPEIFEEWAEKDAKDAKDAKAKQAKKPKKRTFNLKELGLIKMEMEMGETKAEAEDNLLEIEKGHPGIAEGAPLTKMEEGLVAFEEEFGESFEEALVNAQELEAANPDMFADEAGR